jgi:hypothetical protein
VPGAALLASAHACRIHWQKSCKQQGTLVQKAQIHIKMGKQTSRPCSSWEHQWHGCNIHYSFAMGIHFLMTHLECLSEFRPQVDTPSRNLTIFKRLCIYCNHATSSPGLSIERHVVKHHQCCTALINTSANSADFMQEPVSLHLHDHKLRDTAYVDQASSDVMNGCRNVRKELQNFWTSPWLCVGVRLSKGRPLTTSLAPFMCTACW